MGIQLLNSSDLEQLRTSSVLSTTPVAQTFCTEMGSVQLVAIQQWVLPKNLFVTLWMWYMLDSVVYRGHVDHEVTDQIIGKLNPAWIHSMDQKPSAFHKPSSSQKNPKELLNLIYFRMKSEYESQSHSLEHKRQIFHRILDELAA